jgi:hypothetical protein
VRLRQARRSVAPYAMLRYLLLLANPAQLFPVDPGKDEHTSRSAIVLGTGHKHDDGRGRCVSLQKIFPAGRLRHPLVTTASRVQACRLPVLHCRRNCFDLAESENDASSATGIIRLNIWQMKSAFASVLPTCLGNAWPHTQLLAAYDGEDRHQFPSLKLPLRSCGGIMRLSSPSRRIATCQTAAPTCSPTSVYKPHCPR